MNVKRRRKINSAFTATIALAIVLYVGIGYLLSNLILYPAERRSIAESSRVLKERFHYDQDSILQYLPQPAEVSFASSTSGLKLRGWLFAGVDTADCGIVMAHGITENRANTLKYAGVLADCGCAMLLYDHRAHGSSDGEYLSGGYFESADVLAAQHWLSDSLDIPLERIGLVGESWGAAAVLLAASQSDSIAWVLADSPYMSWRDAIVERGDKLYGRWLRIFMPGTFAWVRMRSGARVREAAPRDRASDISVPTLIVHSAVDTITPPSHSVEIGRELDPHWGKVEILDWNAWHAQNALARPAAYRQLMERHFDRFGHWFCTIP